MLDLEEVLDILNFINEEIKVLKRSISWIVIELEGGFNFFDVWFILLFRVIYGS